MIKSTSGAEREELISFCLAILKASKTLKVGDLIGNDVEAREILGRAGKQQASNIILNLNKQF